MTNELVDLCKAVLLYENDQPIYQLLLDVRGR